MAGITVTREDLQLLAGLDVTPERWEAVERQTRSIIRTGYRGDLDVAEGRVADVLDSVFTSVSLRLLTNPTGDRSVSLGDASFTTGGGDEALAEPLSLTSAERRDLAALRGRRPSFLVFRPFTPGAPL